MGSSRLKPRVTVETLDETTRRLEACVADMEKRYECRSEVMFRDVSSGKTRETVEIAKWLTNYRVLTSLREAPGGGSERGSLTRSTKAST